MRCAMASIRVGVTVVVVHGGEEGMEAARVKGRRLPGDGFGVGLGDAAHGQAPGDPLVLPPPGERGKGISATSAADTQAWAWSS